MQKTDNLTFNFNGANLKACILRNLKIDSSRPSLHPSFHRVFFYSCFYLLLLDNRDCSQHRFASMKASQYVVFIYFRSPVVWTFVASILRSKEVLFTCTAMETKATRIFGTVNGIPIVHLLQVVKYDPLDVFIIKRYINQRSILNFCDFCYKKYHKLQKMSVLGCTKWSDKINFSFIIVLPLDVIYHYDEIYNFLF